MKNSLSEFTLLQLGDFISSKLGLYFAKDRWNDLERCIISAAAEYGNKDAEDFVQHIMTSPLTTQKIELLAAHLTINETFFWREPETFAALEQKILPELVKLRQKEKAIRIWSAGCSTGEEPYSIAIALSRIVPNINSWNISILATDVNPRVLGKAAAGEYSHWSFRNAPKWLKENYFVQKEKNKFEIIPSIKSMVKFQNLNLAEEVFPSPLTNTNTMNIIFCRNVLMYFTQDCSKKVTQRLFSSLQRGGYLVVSASELSLQNFSEFLHINLPGMVVYQKPSTTTKHLNKTPEIEVLPEPQSFQSSFTPCNISNAEYLQPVEKENEIPKINELYPSVSSYAGNNYEIKGELPAKERTVEELIILIRDLANQEKLIEALALCEEAIAAYKLNPRLYYLHAIILQENNQLDEAIVSLKRAIYLDSNFILSYYSLGNLYKRLGKKSSAKRNYDIVMSLLNKCGLEEIIPESEGLTAGRFKEILST